MTTVAEANNPTEATVTVSDCGMYLVADGVKWCPLCLEQAGTVFCCATPTGPAAAQFLAEQAKDQAALDRELRNAPDVRVRVGARRRRRDTVRLATPTAIHNGAPA
jgi:hypothetical protein